MRDEVEFFLKPILTSQEFKKIHKTNYRYKTWYDVNVFLKSCFDNVKSLPVDSLLSNFDFIILVKSKDSDFISQEIKEATENLISSLADTWSGDIQALMDAAKSSRVPDPITIYLKPVLTTRQYNQIRFKKLYKNSWSDITGFLNLLILTAARVSEQNIKSNFSCGILFACLDSNFVTEKQNRIIKEYLAKIPPAVMPVHSNSKEVKTLEESLLNVDSNLVLNKNTVYAFKQAVKDKTGDCGYYTKDSEVSLKAILLKRLQLCLSAEKRNLEFNLTDSDVKTLLERKTCYYTGARFAETENYHRTIDRIDSSKGYIQGNVVACTHGINQIKNDILENTENYNLTVRQLKMFAAKL